MAEDKKYYISKVRKGGKDIYVKDVEARSDIRQLQSDVAALNPASAASVETCEAIIDELT